MCSTNEDSPVLRRTEVDYMIIENIEELQSYSFVSGNDETEYEMIENIKEIDVHSPVLGNNKIDYRMIVNVKQEELDTCSSISENSEINYKITENVREENVDSNSPGSGNNETDKRLIETMKEENASRNNVIDYRILANIKQEKQDSYSLESGKNETNYRIIETIKEENVDLYSPVSGNNETDYRAIETMKEEKVDLYSPVSQNDETNFKIIESIKEEQPDVYLPASENNKSDYRMFEKDTDLSSSVSSHDETNYRMIVNVKEEQVETDEKNYRMIEKINQEEPDNYLSGNFNYPCDPLEKSLSLNYKANNKNSSRGKTNANLLAQLKKLCKARQSSQAVFKEKHAEDTYNSEIIDRINHCNGISMETVSMVQGLEKPDGYCKKELEIERMANQKEKMLKCRDVTGLKVKGENAESENTVSSREHVIWLVTPNKTQSVMPNKKQIDKFDTKFQCGICCKVFIDQNTIRIHHKIHFPEEPYHCYNCNKSFGSNLDKYRRHLMLHTGEKTHKCHLCTRQFAVLQSLQTHLNFHKGVTKGTPGVAGGTLGATGGITGVKGGTLEETTEKANSAGETSETYAKSYKKWCFSSGNVTCFRKKPLAGHIKIKKEEKYTCSVCCKSFTSRSYLQRHIKIHTGKKSLKCGIYGKEFFSQ